MQTYEGILKNKSERPWNDVVLHSFQLEGQNIWFRTGQKGLTLDEGTPIRFKANPTNKQVDLDSMEKLESLPSSTSSSTNTTSRTGSTSTTREDYWTNRERLDSVRTARADATRIVCAALAHDHLPHASNIAKGKRLDLLVGYVKEITEELINYEEK
jgi:hypothetical protein